MAQGEATVVGEGEVLDVLGRSWGWVFAFGIATLVAGILVVSHPRDTIYFLAIVLGIWLFISGLFRMVAAIADKRDTAGVRWLLALLGLVSIILGVFFFHRTDQSVTTVVFLIGLFWVVAGVLEFAQAAGDPDVPARGYRMVMGLLALAAGILTLVWPHVTLSVLGVIMGIWLIIYSLLMIGLSFQVRRLKSAR